MIERQALLSTFNALLQPERFKDYGPNGLQVEGRAEVRKIVSGVTASLALIEAAVAAQADAIFVHHGLFWRGHDGRVTGWLRQRLGLLLGHNINLFAYHLPLDAHPQLGNNAQLCAALGLKNAKPFFASHGQNIGLKTQAKISRDELAKRLERATGVKPKMIPGGKNLCEKIGVVTGGAGAELKQAAAEGMDTFITGEGPHWTFALAEDLGLNVFYGGHYATETFGVKALAAELSKKFRVPWEFLDHATGL